jgi:hypothetical protein
MYVPENWRVGEGTYQRPSSYSWSKVWNGSSVVFWFAKTRLSTKMARSFSPTSATANWRREEKAGHDGG